ncbi:hypothetical protein [Brevibacillus fortis]|uniref:hypothetical protein n=1 Tax=Brevibacillus fortis TaxID=2126352 RepID=UPI0038FC9D2F
MSREQSYIRYGCDLLFENHPNYNDIKKIVIDVTGSDRKLFNESSIFRKEEIGIKLQLKLTPSSVTQLREKLSDINVMFDEVFYRDLRHYHIEIDHNGAEHEGIAIELEDESWNLYYEGGCLIEILEKSDIYPFLEERGFLIGKIDSSAIDHIDEIFKEIIDNLSK